MKIEVEREVQNIHIFSHLARRRVESRVTVRLRKFVFIGLR